MGGAFFTRLSMSPHIRFRVAHWIEGCTSPLWGILICSFGVMMMVGLYFLYRRRYIRISCRSGEVEIEMALIRRSITDFLRKKFPKGEVSADVIAIRGKKLEICTSLPDFDEEIVEELRVLLREQFGYERDFILMPEV